MNEFILHIIPPPKRLNWKNPRRLLIRSFLNHLWGDPAPIGHLFVEFGNAPRVLTGMSRISLQESSRVVRQQKLGLGSFFHDFRGRLDVANEALKEIDWAKKNGRYAAIRVQVSEETSQKMLKTMNDWIIHGSFRHYGGGHRVETGTGSGCAEFGMFFLSQALGLKATHNDWYRDVIAPREWVGGQKFDRKVSLLRLLVGGNTWAKSESQGYRYQTPDPELMFDWVMARGGDVTLQSSDVTWSTAVCEAMQFTGGYEIESNESVNRERLKITLKP